MTAALLAVLFAVTAGAAWSAWHWWPAPHRQFLAAVPMGPDGPEGRRGLNLTWYGLLAAGAYAFASALFVVLAVAAGARLGRLLGYLGLLSLACALSAKWIVYWVEGHRHGFTVGGAVFTGFALAPCILWGMEAAGHPLPLWPVLSASLVAYAFGEGLGRLACISFGCCYGRPLADLPPRWAARLSPLAHRVQGPCRKAVFVHGLERVPLVPVPALTVLALGLAGCAGAALHAAGAHRAAVWGLAAATQLWRFASEFLRADERGDGQRVRRVSAYQWMALGAVVLLLPVTVLAPPSPPFPFDPLAGLRALWNPAVLLLLQAFLVLLFLRMGRSTVTGSRLTFHVHPDLRRAATPPAPRGGAPALHTHF